MITGFQAQVAVDDGGTGGATGSTSTKFDGLLTLDLPEREASSFEATELNQTTDGTTVDNEEREEPTGYVKNSPAKCEIKFTKANFNRVNALLGKRDYTWILTSPDDQTSGTPTKLVDTFKGWVSKVGGIKYEKKNPVSIMFEITTQRKHTFS